MSAIRRLTPRAVNRPRIERPIVAGGAAETLRRIADSSDGEWISLDEILTALGNHAFGLLVLALALPNAIPGPIIPGMSVPFAIGIILMASQILRGQPQPLLPGWLRRRSMRRERFRRFVNKAEPLLRRLERWLKPRSSRLLHAGNNRGALGVALIIFAVVLALPIPLGNGPEAFAICIVALGLFEGDERVVGIGVIGGVLAILVNAGIVVAGFALFHAAEHIHHAAG